MNPRKQRQSRRGSTAKPENKSDASVAPSADDVDALLRFLPIFEREGFDAGSWLDRAGTMPTFVANREVNEFVHAAYEHRFVVSFDWPSWQGEARAVLDSPGLLAQADFETLRRLITTIVRANRFCEGTVLGAIQNGEIVRILRRLDVLARPT